LTKFGERGRLERQRQTSKKSLVLKRGGRGFEVLGLRRVAAAGGYEEEGQLEKKGARWSNQHP